MPVLNVRHLNKKFISGFWPLNIGREPFVAVNDISFDLQQGEILGLLGANGAGKTTTIQMLLGTLKPTSGDIIFFGKELAKHRSEILAKVSFASTYVKLPPHLTVEQNLTFYSRLYGVPAEQRRKRIPELLEYFGIAHLKNKETGPLSAGQITRVMLVKAFCIDPAVVLLDEPTASLDPDIARDVRNYVLEIRKNRGTSFIFTSHNMDEVSTVCDRVLVMQQGTIIASDTPTNLARSISTARLRLTITDNLETLLKLCVQEAYAYDLEGNHVTIHADSEDIPHLLHDIAHAHIRYSNVKIEEPTLEEYFIELLGRQRGR